MGRQSNPRKRAHLDHRFLLFWIWWLSSSGADQNPATGQYNVTSGDTFLFVIRTVVPD